MVDPDLGTLASISLAIGAIIGLLLTARNLRMLTRQRRADMLIKLNPNFNIPSNEIYQSMVLIESSDYKDYDDFVAKFGDLVENKPMTKAHLTILNYHEGIGVMLKKKLVDADLVYEIYASDAVWTWDKMLPFIKGVRGKLGQKSWENAEYLYNEMKRLNN